MTDAKPTATTKQSWKMTAAEILSGKVVGVAVNWVLNLTILGALLGTTVDPWGATKVSIVFTAVAVIRSTILRRIFEHLRSKGIN